MHIVLFSVPEASAAAAGAEPGAPGGRHALHPGALQLAPVLGGDQRHRRPRRLRPVRPRQGRTHARQRRVQVRNAAVEGVEITMHYFLLSDIPSDNFSSTLYSQLSL